MTLFYWLALSMDWDMPKYGALAIALISLGTTGASFQKGVLRVVGTTIGLAVGMFGLALFAQDRWLMLAFLAAYLVFIGYFMQTSRYGYAWFVAGFLPTLVWATTYGDVDNAFHYAVFRYLETSAGIIIYTAVSALLWPKRAGDALDQQGRALWTDLRTLFGFYRRQLDDGKLPAETAELSARIAGSTSKLLATLQTAYADTPSVIARKRAWEVLRADLPALTDALELWRQSIGDCRELELQRLLPRGRAVLDAVDERLARFGDLWAARSAGEDASPTGDTEDNDAALLEPVDPALDLAAATGLSHFERAALLGFTQQLETLDTTSCRLLHTMRVLAGRETMKSLHARTLPPDPFQPARWDPARLINALFPALCFGAAYVFWILFDPPTGPSVPNMAATFALVILLTPMSALTLMMTMLVVMWVAVAPIYFFVMPELDTGLGLLALVFIYTFFFGWIGGRKPGLKTMGLLLFAMMTGISNQQTYSFLGLVNGGMLFLLSLSVVAVVQALSGPVRPEAAMLRSIRRFFRGCAGILGAFAGHGPRELARTRALRRRYYESMVMPVPRQLQAVETKLDFTPYPADEPGNVRRLVDALHSITLRLQALDRAHARLAHRSVEWSDAILRIGSQMRERFERLFKSWSRLDDIQAEEERTAFERIGRELTRTLDDTLARTPSDRLDDEALVDLYALLGCARGLVQAAAETQGAAKRVSWDQWAEARF